MPRPPANYKRLIVLCDGTWQNILSAEKHSHPTNVARLSRAISPVAVVKDENGHEREVEQIVFYQAGVGTGIGDKLRGGAYGAGLSANIRAAYGFLAHNYDPNPGDEIFFFGFSRGAFTARSIAGLVTKLGLLTKRGMDYFPQVYDEYYDDPSSTPDFEFSERLTRLIGDDVYEKAKDAVKVVGVWDTVEFHGEGMTGEKIEFHNAELSPRVGHAYHALALDERRTPYIPTLWQWPHDLADAAREYQPAADGVGLQVMKQVWFSGAHSDVGGGKFDPACSDVALAWMLAQCATDGKLAFTDEDPDSQDYYLLPDRFTPNTVTAWTRLRQKPDADPLDTVWDKGWDLVEGLSAQDRKALLLPRTRERIHRSIASRDLHAWPCAVLDGTTGHAGAWPLKKPGDFGRALPVLEPDAAADAIEDKYIGRVRPPPGSKGYQAPKL